MVQETFKMRNGDFVLPEVCPRSQVYIYSTCGTIGAVSLLIPLITSDDPAIRDTSLDTLCASLDIAGLQAECAALERFRHESTSLYERVRACFFWGSQMRKP
jgi:hypothetical protein